MFTGIITDIGTVIARDDTSDTVLTIATAYDAAGIALGASIACNGICLTVTEKGTRDGQHWFRVQASQETKSRTTLGQWQSGQRLNLERALKLGDELGGHLVTGHVDDVATLENITPSSASFILRFSLPTSLARFCAAKGAITLNGVSLTVNKAEHHSCEVNIIPHTWAHTTFAQLGTGDKVNLEVDMFARYCARLLETL